MTLISLDVLGALTPRTARQGLGTGQAFASIFGSLPDRAAVADGAEAALIPADPEEDAPIPEKITEISDPDTNSVAIAAAEDPETPPPLDRPATTTRSPTTVEAAPLLQDRDFAPEDSDPAERAAPEASAFTSPLATNSHLALVPLPLRSVDREPLAVENPPGTATTLETRTQPGFVAFPVSTRQTSAPVDAAEGSPLPALPGTPETAAPPISFPSSTSAPSVPQPDEAPIKSVTSIVSDSLAPRTLLPHAMPAHMIATAAGAVAPDPQSQPGNPGPATIDGPPRIPADSRPLSDTIYRSLPRGSLPSPPQSDPNLVPIAPMPGSDRRTAVSLQDTVLLTARATSIESAALPTVPRDSLYIPAETLQPGPRQAPAAAVPSPDPAMPPVAEPQRPQPPKSALPQPPVAIRVTASTAMQMTDDAVSGPVSAIKFALAQSEGAVLDRDPQSPWVHSVEGRPHAPPASHNLAPTTPQPAQIDTIRHIAHQIEARIPAAETGFDLALNPEELGHVRLRLNVTDTGSTLLIQADRPETLDLMRRHVGQLEQDLRAAGHHALTLEFDNSGSEARREKTSEPAQDGPARPRVVDTAPPDAPRAVRAILSDSLDLRL